MSTEARQAVAAVRRFFDPCSNRSGFDDSLRRAVNRFQQLRGGFSFTDASRGRGRAASTPGKPRDRDWSKCSQESSMASQSTSCGSQSTSSGSPHSTGTAGDTTAMVATSPGWQVTRQQMRCISWTDGNVSHELDRLPALRVRPVSQAGGDIGRVSQDGRQAWRASPARPSSLVIAGTCSINRV